VFNITNCESIAFSAVVDRICKTVRPRFRIDVGLGTPVVMPANPNTVSK
jgi:hypothetical protein